METEEVSIWREIEYKMWQSLSISQASFNIFRTLNYVTGTDGELDWDFVPLMLLISTYFICFNLIGHFIFDSDRTLTVKVYNENRTLRGKAFAREFA